MSAFTLDMLPAVLAQTAGGAEQGALGTMEMVFLGLWLLFSGLYWNTYKKDESLPAAALKVAGLLGFVYVVISAFDWLQEVVPADQVLTLWGLFSAAEVEGPRVPFMGSAFTWFVVALLVLVAWYSRRKFATVVGVILSAWDRGHWYMLPVIFILMTVGLLLVAAAASPVLSPFIYTLF
jgi:hypothetical protein